jgi:hypothetical protein
MAFLDLNTSEAHDSFSMNLAVNAVNLTQIEKSLLHVVELAYAARPQEEVIRLLGRTDR